MNIPESQVERPEGFQGSSSDVFVRDQEHDLQTEQSFRQAGELFLSKRHKNRHGNGENNGAQGPRGPQGPQGPQGPNGPGAVDGDEVRMFPDREGFKTDFLGVDYALPTLGDSIKDKASHLIDHPDETVLKYNHFSIVQNKERRQCFYTACNIDGTQSQRTGRSNDWVLDGRIPLEDQIGNEGYARNNIDKGHMVRRLDPCWGGSARMGSDDTFVYTNAALQHSNLNQKEWLALEDHVLSSAHGQKMNVLTGPVFSDKDRAFDNKGLMKEGTQIPEKFWKVVVWNDQKSGELKGAAFVLSQSDILDRDSSLFKGGFDPDRFSVYQVPISQLEEMTDIHFAPCHDITDEACKLTAADGYVPHGLN